MKIGLHSSGKATGAEAFVATWWKITSAPELSHGMAFVDSHSRGHVQHRRRSHQASTAARATQWHVGANMAVEGSAKADHRWPKTLDL